MKNNVAFRLALSSIKKDKKSYIISFIMMIIAFTSVMIFPSCIEVYERINILQNEIDYGRWSVCYQNLNEQSRQFLEDNHFVEKCISLSYVGRLENNNYIANYSKDFFDIASIELAEGRLPQSEDEIIAVHQESHVLNEIIKVTYYTDKEYIKEYKVVGCINDYNQKWTTPSPDYFTYNNPEYKNYTYITSDYSLSIFEGFNENCMYNFSILGDNVSYIKNNWSRYDAIDNGLSLSDAKTTYTNLFIGLLSVGLFTVIFRDSTQREKTVFLLRCIGMSKRDMKKYIFYEIILLSLIALGISFVFGSIVLFIISIYCFNLYKVFLFFDLLILAMKYIVAIMVIIICIICLLIMPISVRMMNSLIHKTERTQLKKYHRMRRMNVFNVSRSVAGRCFSYVFSVGIMITVLTSSIYTIIENINLLKEDQGRAYITYEYSSPYITEEIVKTLEGTINEYKSIKTKNKTVQFNENFSRTYTFVSLESLDDIEERLVKGRLPVKYNECLAYVYNEYIVYGDAYSIGDKFLVQESSYDEKGEELIQSSEFEIVGMVNISDYNELDRRYIFDIQNNGFVVFEDSFLFEGEDGHDDWFHQKYVSSSKDLYFDFHEALMKNTILLKDGSQLGITTYYQAKIDNLNMSNDSPYMIGFMLVLILIAIYYLIVMTKFMIDLVNKDLKLIRCLGMTFKQSMFVYIWLSWLILLVTSMYSYIIGVYPSLPDERVIRISVTAVLLLIYLLFFLLFAYQRTNKTLEFYPTEVERYY